MIARVGIYFAGLFIALAIAGGCGKGEKKTPTLTRAQAWALGAAALLAERNYERHDLLGGREWSDDDMKGWRAGLVEGWGISSRDGLIDTLRLLEEEGDRREFEDLGAHVTSLSKRRYKRLLKKSRDDSEKHHRIQLVKENYGRLGEKSLVGWDYCRYISLCRWGYLAGYFTEEEAWSRITPAARKLQKTFYSWKDLGQNYLIGREFWSYEETEKNGHLYRDAYHRLLDNPVSPWNIYPWDMELDDSQTRPLGASPGRERGT